MIDKKALNDLFRDKPSELKTALDNTTAAAKLIIASDARKHEDLTARLRAARLARDDDT